jgi:hypothetical protein
MLLSLGYGLLLMRNMFAERLLSPPVHSPMVTLIHIFHVGSESNLRIQLMNALHHQLHVLQTIMTIGSEIEINTIRIQTLKGAVADRELLVRQGVMDTVVRIESGHELSLYIAWTGGQTVIT